MACAENFHPKSVPMQARSIKHSQHFGANGIYANSKCFSGIYRPHRWLKCGNFGDTHSCICGHSCNNGKHTWEHVPSISCSCRAHSHHLNDCGQSTSPVSTHCSPNTADGCHVVPAGDTGMTVPGNPSCPEPGHPSSSYIWGIQQWGLCRLTGNHTRRLPARMWWKPKWPSDGPWH